MYDIVFPKLNINKFSKIIFSEVMKMPGKS